MPNLSSLPFALPNSGLPGVAWPAVPDDAASRMLALQLQLDQSQWWSAAMIEKRQFEQLHGVLAHAQRNVPFHGPRLDAAGFDPRVPLDHDQWSRIPVMTRRDAQLNRDLLAGRSLPPGHGPAREITTSGSIGRAITLLGTAVTSMMWQAITLREHFWHRRDLAARLAVIRSRSGGEADYPAGRIDPGWGPSTDVAYRTGECAILNTSSTTAEQAEWLARQDPDYLLTTATRARELAHLFRRGPGLRRLREVRTYGETLADDLRGQCRDTWGVPVVDMYSAEEVGYIALQCPDHEHYHVQCENVLVEILDDRGRPCRAGEIGRVVISALHNFATPIIRYEIGDYAEVGGVCPCGRGLPVIARIMGRVRNMLRMPDGNTRWPNFMLAKTHRDLPIAQIQIVQTALDSLELRAVPEMPLSEQERKQLIDYVRDWAGPEFKVGLRVVDTIPRGAGGKFEEFLSELPQ